MKRLLVMILSLVILVSLVPFTFAQSERVIDGANLLTATEISTLEENISEIQMRYSMDVVILTVDTIGWKTSEEFADDYYDENGFGLGLEASGVLFLISMEERDWAISTCGNAITALPDYAIEEVFSALASDLSNGNYASAFSIFLDELSVYFEAYQNGNVIDGYVTDYTGPGSFETGTREDVAYAPEAKEPVPQRLLRCLGIAFVLGLIVSTINLLVLRHSMNTIRKQSGAVSYMKDGTFDLKIARDIFLYSRESRIKIDTDSGHSGSHGGGSSIHHSSSGRSHGGGHGKF